MVVIKKPELVEVRCPYCDDFWDYILPDNFFMYYDEDEKGRTVYCHAQNCGKPFIIEK